MPCTCLFAPIIYKKKTWTWHSHGSKDAIMNIMPSWTHATTWTNSCPCNIMLWRTNSCIQWCYHESMQMQDVQITNSAKVSVPHRKFPRRRGKRTSKTTLVWNVSERSSKTNTGLKCLIFKEVPKPRLIWSVERSSKTTLVWNVWFWKKFQN